MIAKELKPSITASPQTNAINTPAVKPKTTRPPEEMFYATDAELANIDWIALGMSKPEHNYNGHFDLGKAQTFAKFFEVNIHEEQL